jgi:hypothetical protein
VITEDTKANGSASVYPVSSFRFLVVIGGATCGAFRRIASSLGHRSGRVLTPVVQGPAEHVAVGAVGDQRQEQAEPEASCPDGPLTDGDADTVAAQFGVPPLKGRVIVHNNGPVRRWHVWTWVPFEESDGRGRTGRS